MYLILKDDRMINWFRKILNYLLPILLLFNVSISAQLKLAKIDDVIITFNLSHDKLYLADEDKDTCLICSNSKEYKTRHIRGTASVRDCDKSFWQDIVKNSKKENCYDDLCGCPCNEMSIDLIIGDNDTCKVLIPCGIIDELYISYKNICYKKDLDSALITIVTQKYEEVGKMAFFDLFEMTND